MAKGKYQEWLTPDGITRLEAWARDGLTDEQLAAKIGITAATLYDWKNKYPEISEALKRGKEVVDIEVENALLKRALGYTDAQLRQWRKANHEGCEIDGKHYTTYQASQLMRTLETKVRQQKDIANLAKASGDDVLRREAQANIRDLRAKYAEVARKAGLRQRTDKMIIESYTK